MTLLEKNASKITNFYQFSLPKSCQSNSAKLLVEKTWPVEPNQTWLPSRWWTKLSEPDPTLAPNAGCRTAAGDYKGTQPPY